MGITPNSGKPRLKAIADTIEHSNSAVIGFPIRAHNVTRRFYELSTRVLSGCSRFFQAAYTARLHRMSFHQTQIPAPKITAALATPLGVASPLPSFRLPRSDHLLLGFTVSFLVGGILYHAAASGSCSVMIFVIYVAKNNLFRISERFTIIFKGGETAHSNSQRTKK